MGSRMANNGPHSAGIFADMTVDGPEIGTLVVVVDRAKNLPNRKTMGKQNPYCAARLGKEARKTETDKRGGQTPRWDQEIRFTVHDSPDYYTLKVSVFSEDKRTDLIGEAWISLTDVVVAGGGKSDVWQQLSCKGKYSGEIRIELTYYDSREKQEKEKILSVADELKQTYGGLGGSKVKRRPLPVNPNAPNTTPVVIPERALPGRARHGPRDLATPPRANSMPLEGPKTYNYPHSQATLFGQTPIGEPHGSVSAGTTPVHQEIAPPDQYYGEFDPNLGPQAYEPETYDQPDFLPQLGPSRTQRGPLPAQARYAQRPAQQPQQPHLQASPHHPHHQMPLPHSHSAPAVPQHPEGQEYNDSYQLRTDYPEPIPDVDYQYQQVRQRRGSNLPPGWEHEQRDPHMARQPYIPDEEPEGPPPPPPPIHSNSSPAVPHYSSPHSRPFPPPTQRYDHTPPSARQQYVPNSSPLQSIERGYGQYQTPPSHRHPARGRSVDAYGDSPYQGSYGSTPNLTPPNQTPPSQGSGHYSRPYPANRHSVADLYNTPSRPHPLSQEVPRARSPNPHGREGPGSARYQQDYRGRDAVPLIKPRAISPQPSPASAPSSSASKAKSTYSIQHPVRAFATSDESPLSTSQPGYGRQPSQNRPTPTRKSVSPRPSISEESYSATPFSPDSFDVHNPSISESAAAAARAGPIVGWHGQEIDPSDHLPVDSWAPEPKKNTPDKTYGLGRDRDFGPRTQGVTNTAGRISRDTMINVRVKQPSAPPPEPEQPQSAGKIRARLVKKPGHGSSPNGEPLRDLSNFNPVPNPYEQQQFSRSFNEGSPGMGDGYGNRFDTGYGPPALPPKVPLQQQQSPQPDYYGGDALSREISSIDLGSSRRGPAPPSFQPVRSHRDRNSYY